MDIVQIVGILLAVILIFLAISIGRSKADDTAELHQYPYERISPTESLDIHGEPTSSSNDRGNVGSRDTSHDGHRDSRDGGDRGGADTDRRSGGD